MDRTEARIAPAGGGDRTSRTGARLRRWPGAARAVVSSAAVVAWLLVTLGGGVAAGATVGSAASAGRGPAGASPGDGLTLASQSPWVGPGQPHEDLTLGLRITSSSPRSTLSLTVTVYDPLTTRSAFDETLTGHELGGVDTRSPALAVPTLPTDASGVTELTIPVVGDGPAGGGAPGAWTADLGCSPGSCAGVYPVKVTLTDATSGSGAQLITYLVYDDPSPHAQALRFALVVPLTLPPPVADARGVTAAADAPSVDRLDSLIGSLAAGDAEPLTLVPDPATMAGLATTGHTRTVAAVDTLAASPLRQTLSQSFVPIDAAALVDAGLADELGLQLRRGAQVLASPGVAVRAAPGTWVATSAVDQATVDVLAAQYPHLVVPADAVSGPTGPLTVSQPFSLSSGHGAQVTAAVTDPGLDAHLAAASGGDPVLAAEQLLADLSFVYDEAPNLLGADGAPATRGMVAVAPTYWSPAPAFVSAMLSGLRANPLIVPVTLDQLFAQVPVGADGEATVRRPTAAGTGGLPARALRTARAAELGFESAAGGSAAGDTVVQKLDDLLLASEARTLSTRQQEAALAGFHRALGAQLRLLTVRSDTVRLTAGAASVPITLVRNTSYPVTVVVQLTSDKLRFPAAAAQAPGALCRTPQVSTSAERSSFSAVCVLDRPTDAVYVNMRARTSGDFRIDVTVASPRSGLVLAGGELTVRSISTSAVAIALSAVALAVLGAWWARTVWRARWRRGAHSVADAGERS